MKKWHVILAAALAMGTMTALTGCGSTQTPLERTAEYLKTFPALNGKYSFHLCESADGVEL